MPTVDNPAMKKTLLCTATYLADHFCEVSSKILQNCRISSCHIVGQIDFVP